MSQWESQTRKLNNHYQSGGETPPVSDAVQGTWVWYNFHYFGQHAKVYFSDVSYPPPPSIDGNAYQVGTSIYSGGESIRKIKMNARTILSPVKDRNVIITYTQNVGYPLDRNGQLQTDNINNSLTGANKIPFVISSYDPTPTVNQNYYDNYNEWIKWAKRSRFSYNGSIKPIYDCLYADIQDMPTAYGQPYTGKFFEALLQYSYNGNYTFLRQKRGNSYLDKPITQPIDDDTYINMFVLFNTSANMIDTYIQF